MIIYLRDYFAVPYLSQSVPFGHIATPRSTYASGSYLKQAVEPGANGINREGKIVVPGLFISLEV